MTRKFWFLTTGMILTTVVLCRCSGGSASATSSFACTATGTLVDPNVATSGLTSVSVAILNAPDAGPFTISIGGVPMKTTSSTVDVLQGPFASTVTTGAPVTIQDTDDTSAIATCAITSNGTFGGVYPYPTPTPTGGYYYPPSTGGYTYPPSTGIYAFSCPTYSSTTMTSISCWLDRANGYFYVGDTIVYNVVTSSGDTIVLTAWDPGEAWTTPPAFPMQIPVGVTYEQPGPKHLQFCAASSSRTNVVCNNGQPMIDDIHINARY